MEASRCDYVVLNPVFSMFKKPPAWYDYVRVEEKESGAIRWCFKETYELKVYGCLHDEYIKKYISLN